MFIRRITTAAAIAVTTIGLGAAVAAPANASSLYQNEVTVNNQTASGHPLQLTNRTLGNGSSEWSKETPKPGFVLNSGYVDNFVVKAHVNAAYGSLYFSDLADGATFRIDLAADGLLPTDTNGGIWGTTTGGLSLDLGGPSFGRQAGAHQTHHIAVRGS